ncbi:MAG: hypothetical protein ACP5HS_08630 [Anaerolineae bacterium]
MRSVIPSRWLRRGLQLVLLLGAFAFLTSNAQAQSPTMDEQNHLARGYALLRTGDPRLSVEHPPLINLLESLPLGRGVALPLDQPCWENGDWYTFADLFLWKVNSKPDRMVFLGRMPIVGLTLLLGALAARWARMLGGPVAGVVAPALTLLDPNILAHGSLATTDLGIAFSSLLTAYVVWRVAHKPTPLGIAASGVAVGAMLASKSSALVFWGSLGLLWVGSFIPFAPRRGLAKALASRGLHFLAITAVGLLVLWGTYAFQVGPTTEGGPSLPMGTYWGGLAQIFRQVQGGRPSYLLGQTRLGGWPLYFPITFGVKTPLPVLLLLPLAVFSPVADRRWRDTAFLLVPVTIYWFSALVSGLNLGYRHLLPTLPFLYVWVAQRLGRTGRVAWRRVGFALVAWLVVETAWIAPHFLAYFNPVGGGPEQGWRVVADSNIDWGQDLKYLREYLDDGALDEPVRLSWFGSSYPERYGIDYEPLPGVPHHFNLWFESPTFNEAQPEPGLYAISVSNLVELYLTDKHFFEYFREREPDARIGYSIYVYRVESE